MQVLNTAFGVDIDGVLSDIQGVKDSMAQVMSCYAGLVGDS
jgi:hypothetical protein